ncbi:cyclic nucleotide-binding domain-containing protein [Dyadobacter chenwenxiniae]|uniref:Cyclic nucleotide-binding domain-containing protein n=1 Tax=Dyadobacter chenwenxiniae TaxID=2906456 RepID=A0A9X1PV28_9BACT|nr:cyclic nucleotide-binding domain-containing protein [Dyadobacter chenwenxiniae]MCF0065676.1 cyclic nucleotide-binding domain-containing protein [Dyadobacter chenwenxiniae]UON85584.1 cyclic nucleotide-binding domain-containing protein [Dyadobacter chenwenxiniae]
MYSEILRATGTYSDDEIRLFEEAVRSRHVARNELIHHKGQVAKSMYYLLTGSIYQYEHVFELDRNIIDLRIQNEWFFDYQSLISQRPSETYIQTFTDSRILELSLETVHYLTGRSIAFLQLNRVLEGALERMKFFDQSMTPAEKYTFILNNRPQLIQTFPLKMIASYLKLTPETLSRVRRSISKVDIS